MPYGSIAEAKKASFPTSAEDIELSLAQINKLASIYDAIKAEGKVDNAMAVAWTSWKEVYEKKEDKWVEREKKKSLSISTLLGLKIQDISHEDLRNQIQNFINKGESQISYTYIREVYDDHFIYEKTINGEVKLFKQLFKIENDEIQFDGESKEVKEEKKYIDAKSQNTLSDIRQIVLDAVDIGNEAPNRLQLLPKGLIKSKKGDFTVDDEGAEEILAYFKEGGIDLVIDYEHATLEKGMKAPAAGWIKKLSANGGIWAEDIEWTEEAKKYLHLKEYRYFSPVVGVDKEDRAIMFHSIALTNVPAIEGQKPIINKHLIKGEQEMIDKIKKLLGLKDDTKEADVLTAVEGLQKNNVKEVVKVLSLKDDATMDDIKSAIEGLKKPAELSEVAKALSLKSDASLPDVLKSIEGLKVPGIAAQELSKEVVLLKNKLAEREQTELIELALKSGQTCKEELDKWGRELALKNPEQFKLIVLSRPDGSVVPLNKIDKGDPATKEHKQEIDEAQVKINKIMGISNEQFEKYAPKEVSV